MERGLIQDGEGVDTMTQARRGRLLAHLLAHWEKWLPTGLTEGGLWEGRGRKGVMRAYEKAEGQETVTEISDMAAC